MTGAPPRKAYFDDVAIDDVADTPCLTVTQAHVDLFTGLAGDVADAPGVVPALLPMCLSVGLGWRSPVPPLAVMAFMGLEWSVLRAVRVGDTVGSRARIVAKRAMREGGVVVEEREVFDQRGEVVQRGRFTYLVARKEKAS